MEQSSKEKRHPDALQRARASIGAIEPAVREQMAQRVYTLLAAQPNTQASAAYVGRVLDIPSRQAQAYLSMLCERGKISVVPVAPSGRAYFFKAGTSPGDAVPDWQELDGWEAGLRSRMALCMLGHNR
ncbi:hypothetical protein CBM2615_B150101 [Cupriavidus taiwanensis]|uniref:Uncharacterized protein n=1 Tax=Cupriavidus taiwanensis TaxID=164546 RepID=A0A375E696_9BURK|nr:hypothetical protein [Cupriavidus taiwanensis]SOZ64411.1 hypothetical protein CBM2614_B160104 [Cupriavidus taiwanensis]SOZ65120.1 hypothetical protein CBM2615_B150101 [Cupriavidus taiwanensis]SOZ68795.1 hypothetical protein CBM2613_B120101 [Cupriavidus taiwanensis]SPA08221.1 hypothetical protein CBM2625_B120100 [Cupriavidus taiwanensis]